MILVPQLPKKLKYLLHCSFPLIGQLTQKSKAEEYVGGRPGYEKEILFSWLLVKKITKLDYRSVSEMAGCSHPTLIRANELFLKSGLYEEVFKRLVKVARKEGLITGKKVAMDSTFVKTFSGKQEEGSEGWNGFKKAYGYKLHLLIDVESSMPLSVKITNGLASDVTLAVPLLKEASEYLHAVEYVLGDKGYDADDLVKYIAKDLKAKAGIPLNRRNRGRNYSWEGAWRNFQEKRKGRSIKHSILHLRTEIERVFSHLKRNYYLGKEETRGILNFAKQVYLSLICYILKKLYTKGITLI